MDQRAQNNRSEQSDGCLGFHVDWPLGSKGTWQGMLRIHSLIQISVAHVLSKCSPSAGTLLPLTPVFLNQVYLRSPRMKLEFVFRYYVQSLSHVQFWPHELQHARFSCLPPFPGIYSDLCPLSQRCYLIISSSAVLFSFCFQSFPASWSFPLSQLFASGGQSIWASTSASILSVNIQHWFTLTYTHLFPTIPTNDHKNCGKFLTTRPLYLFPKKPVCRSRSKS